VRTARPIVLAYHAVDSAWRSPLSISESALEEQAAFFARRGFVGFTASEAERRADAHDLPVRSVVFTFDDAYASTARAADVLGAYGFPGTVFAVRRFVESGEPLSWFGVEGEQAGRMQPMGWGDLDALVGRGWEVGSHTDTHALLTTLDGDALNAELAGSRQALAARLGGCTSIAYPYGIADQRVAEAARSAGYVAGFTLTRIFTADAALLRPRVGLFDADRGMRLRVKLSPPALACRRSRPARLLRRVHRRPWIPSGPEVAA
jgi:peptidoglycan/xylan/chitin deacetylase (PgdA/CDA1 family)